MRMRPNDKTKTNEDMDSNNSCNKVRPIIKIPTAVIWLHT